jgi:5-methylcytosine-specific restriction endonuclease McrA
MEEYRKRDEYKESKKLYYEANKEQIQARNRSSYFSHREERIVKSTEYWRRTKDTPQQQMGRRRAKARRRAALANAHKAPYTSQDATAKMKEFGDRCCYCQKPLQLKTLCLDHFHPILKGGPDVISNIVPACRSCNSSKGARPPELWYFAQPFANQKQWSRIVKALGLKDNVNQLPLF